MQILFGIMLESIIRILEALHKQIVWLILFVHKFIY